MTFKLFGPSILKTKSDLAFNWCWYLGEWNNSFENVLMFISYQTKCLQGFYRGA